MKLTYIFDVVITIFGCSNYDFWMLQYSSLQLLMNVARNLVQMLWWEFFPGFGCKDVFDFCVASNDFHCCRYFFHMLPILLFYVTVQRRRSGC